MSAEIDHNAVWLENVSQWTVEQQHWRSKDKEGREFGPGYWRDVSSGVASIPKTIATGAGCLGLMLLSLTIVASAVWGAVLVGEHLFHVIAGG